MKSRDMVQISLSFVSNRFVEFEEENSELNRPITRNVFLDRNCIMEVSSRIINKEEVIMIEKTNSRWDSFLYSEKNYACLPKIMLIKKPMKELSRKF